MSHQGLYPEAHWQQNQEQCPPLDDGDSSLALIVAFTSFFPVADVDSIEAPFEELPDSSDDGVEVDWCHHIELLIISFASMDWPKEYRQLFAMAMPQLKRLIATVNMMTPPYSKWLRALPNAAKTLKPSQTKAVQYHMKSVKDWRETANRPQCLRLFGKSRAFFVHILKKVDNPQSVRTTTTSVINHITTWRNIVA
eukprot:CAMPEP_0206631328 /NCGR_PEP_ID=MMETSP0325_2-20121206/68136_1 /ASSEMBLY_ACC=CAM_ASM_000347 /TAXON_ID=2866 /ORGANISM="Crypthecodinium cohnii, Strain Seligo" /LENGTH=195 /DNA_ID=CAMNT_0054156423 /DNA_START=378 /DNA_END=965 /DNA_ORIENTATION=-